MRIEKDRWRKSVIPRHIMSRRRDDEEVKGGDSESEGRMEIKRKSYLT